jgi:hypothetical protein
VMSSRFGLPGAMYDMVVASRTTSSLSPSRPCLLLVVSSKRMIGGTLVRVALESMSSFGGVLLGSWCSIEPMCPFSRHPWLVVGQDGLFIIGFVKGFVVCHLAIYCMVCVELYPLDVVSAVLTFLL